MKEIKKTKWERTKRILENLREPKTIGEISKLFYNNPSYSEKRNIYNYLKSLENLGLIQYDNDTRTYQKTGIKKTVFQSKADLELAVKHAKFLILTSYQTPYQRYDQTDPNFVVDLIAFHDKKHSNWYLDRLVFQHIKTGYNKEIYQDLKKYRELMDEKRSDKKGRKPVPEKTLEEIDALKGKLAGIIQRKIVNNVSQGQPLLGECDECPHLKFSVKD